MQQLIAMTEGRLQQKALDILKGADIQFSQEHRQDIALVKNHSMALVFLPAADIPTFVGEGRVDLGITGKDQICEYEALKAPTKDIGLKEIIDLQYGYCKLQVQVPKDSPFKDAKDLIGHNISTSFPGLTRSYYGALEAQLLDPNRDCSVVTQVKTKIKYLGGSVEASCELGVADGIVDLVGMSIAFGGRQIAA